MKIKTNYQQGFTLIEMVVSLAIFTTVVGTAVGALLIMVGTNQQLQEEQSVMTNLSFALDSMTREIRTGVHYFCDSRPNTLSGGSSNIFAAGNDIDTILVGNDLSQDCSAGRIGSQDLHGIAFEEGGNSVTGATVNRILYFHNAADGKVYRKVGAGAPQSIISSGIKITNMEFFVTGSEPYTGTVPDRDDVQPRVTVLLEATASTSETNPKVYKIQTTVTQRTLDI